MARPYSNDLRERVAHSVLSGRTARETAQLFGVSVASAVKWSQRLRATGSAASRVPLVLPARSRRSCARPLYLFQKPAWPLS